MMRAVGWLVLLGRSQWDTASPSTLTGSQVSWSWGLAGPAPRGGLGHGMLHKKMKAAQAPRWAAFIVAVERRYSASSSRARPLCRFPKIRMSRPGMNVPGSRIQMNQP
jgi:hypothetical protein